MSFIVFLLLIASALTPSHTHLYSTDQSFISLLVSRKGLDFVKDLLISEAVSSLTPLHLPQIQKTVKIPLVGNVHMVLSKITIYQIDVSSSYIEPGDAGLSIIASGTTCNLSMSWSYDYRTWLVPVTISDHGDASVQVEGMEVGITLGLENQGGTLKLFLKECECYIKNIYIKLDGGASWLYQGLVDAFEGQIGSAVENAITKNLEGEILKLDSFFQGLPKEIPVDNIASLNVTVVNNALLSNSSIGFEINGLFIANKKSVVSSYGHKNSNVEVSCEDPSKMLGISLDEAVFNSASFLYFNAEIMQWIVDKVPDQNLLNTAGWRFIIPQLYKKYPDDDMNMNVSLSSPPVIKVSENKIDATMYADLIIDVLETGEVIPVACISLVIHAWGSVKIQRNNLVGNVKLDDFTMSLKWSKIGNLRMYLIQPVMWTIIETVFLPYANSRLGKGFPLPIIHGFTLQNAEIRCSNSKITVCSDVVYAESYGLNQLLIS
ncbi:putative BPI/LBP family protein At1g04970 [Malania oleifera]|uniref:putative BPI/LBP family protein At1g04970 n=1 Tax=Malania oleifera TaxID=397392 RepID=UPI0025AEBD4F|nr:putative BPI/LBP family protein At1g04970 [Malania oleifera]